MLRKIYQYLFLWLERRPWGVQMLYHSIRHYKFYDFIETLIVAFVFAMVIRGFFLQAFKIPSGSMQPTLQIGDRLFVNKLVYFYRDPKIGEIVVFKTPKRIHEPRKPIYIKRVVGLSGDEVSIRSVRGGKGNLYVNGERVTHPVIINNGYSVGVYDFWKVKNPLTGELEDRTIPKIYTSEIVPEGEVYVFGDNSANSLDSRYWKGVPINNNVKGKAFLRWWPWDSRLGLIE
jgi:signal peptidase I